MGLDNRENSPIPIGVDAAQAVAGSVRGEDAKEAFLFVDDSLDPPELFELCRDLPHVFGGNEVGPDNAEFTRRLFRHPEILARNAVRQARKASAPRMAMTIFW